MSSGQLTLTITVKHIFFACIKFSRISRVGYNRKIKYPQKFRLPTKGLVHTSRTLGKRQIKMQRNFYAPKSRNYDSAKIYCFTVTCMGVFIFFTKFMHYSNHTLSFYLTCPLSWVRGYLLVRPVPRSKPWELLMHYFYRPDSIPVNQQQCQNAQGIVWKLLKQKPTAWSQIYFDSGFLHNHMELCKINTDLLSEFWSRMFLLWWLDKWNAARTPFAKTWHSRLRSNTIGRRSSTQLHADVPRFKLVLCSLFVSRYTIPV